jgi:hypothetical protein
MEVGGLKVEEAEGEGDGEAEAEAEGGLGEMEMTVCTRRGGLIRPKHGAPTTRPWNPDLGTRISLKASRALDGSSIWCRYVEFLNQLLLFVLLSSTYECFIIWVDMFSRLM